MDHDRSGFPLRPLNSGGGIMNGLRRFVGTGIRTDAETETVSEILSRWCSASCRLPIMQGRAGTFHLFQDVGGLGGPDERLGTFIVMVDVFADGSDEFLDIAEDAAA